MYCFLKNEIDFYICFILCVWLVVCDVIFMFGYFYVMRRNGYYICEYEKNNEN